jgi:hypothetical protein
MTTDPQFRKAPQAVLLVNDGAGGMRQVPDLRFASEGWPVELTVPKDDSETWMANVRAEMDARHWNASGMSQLDTEENSGTLCVHNGVGSNPPTLHLVWEKPRNGDLKVKARPDGSPPMEMALVREFIDAVSVRVEKGITTRLHRRTMLTYDGLPWRGELWITCDIRLGPPSRFPESLLGQQIVIIDAMVEGIGHQGVTSNFQKLIADIKIFLGVMLGMQFTLSRTRMEWVTEFDDKMKIVDCTLKHVGYTEVAGSSDFPKVGSAPVIARETVKRPGLGRSGIWPDMRERSIPDDFESLWSTFSTLPPKLRNQFLQSGNAYSIANSMWPDQRTTYAVFLVVACEALKPVSKKYDRMNIYDVISSLCGVPEAQRFREMALHPQQVRNQHVHRGKLAADELFPMFINDDFRDPTFDNMLRELVTICRTCMIEWLRCKGSYRVVRLPTEKRSIIQRVLGYIKNVRRR